MSSSDAIDNDAKQRLIVVTGLSGSGKSVALKTLEDLGFYCVDNLPLGLIESFVHHTMDRDGYDCVALGIDVRNALAETRPLHELLPHALSALRERVQKVDAVFLRADDATLIKRYGETRRRHPLASAETPLVDAIQRERDLLRPLSDSADVVLDTSTSSVHQLRRALCDAVGAADQPLALLIESFAFKHGVPTDVDFAFDVRCLPNPHWQPELRALTGREPAVASFLSDHPLVGEMVGDICNWLERWIPEFEREHRSVLTIGIGCTGGKHRSVYVAEQVAEHFLPGREHVMTYHRELL